MLTNKTYDVLKWIAQIFLPAIGTLYFALSEIWGINIFPNPAEIVGSISAIDIFLGTLLHFDTKEYNKTLNDISIK